jgi:hypothetical protein
MQHIEVAQRPMMSVNEYIFNQKFILKSDLRVIILIDFIRKLLFYKDFINI